MRNLLSYLYLILLTIMFGWLVFNHPPTIFTVLTFVVGTGLIIALAWVFIRLQDAWGQFLYRRRMARLLGPMTLEQVLEQSPYDYGYVFQGDDGYRIWRKDAVGDFIQSDVSKQSAQLWIVEQYFNHNRP